MNLPCKECGGQCCTYPPFSPTEFEVVKKKHGIPLGTFFVKSPQIPGNVAVIPVVDDNGTCPWFQKNQCSIYKDRPQACKDYGVVKALPCKYLYPEKSLEQIQKQASYFMNNSLRK